MPGPGWGWMGVATGYIYFSCCVSSCVCLTSLMCFFFFFSGILSYQLLQEFLSLPLEPVCKICFRTLDNSHLDVISELAKLRFLDKVVYKYSVRSYLNSRESLKTDFIFINLYLTLPLPPLDRVSPCRTRYLDT